MLRRGQGQGGLDLTRKEGPNSGSRPLKQKEPPVGPSQTRLLAAESREFAQMRMRRR